MPLIKLNPITHKRLRRFRELKRAYGSFWILVALYLLSLVAELLCNSAPLYVRYQGHSYFPVLKFYPDHTFTGSGKYTRPDYRAVHARPEFRDGTGNFMVFPPVPYGPYEVIDPAQIDVPDRVTVVLVPEPRIGSVVVTPDLAIVKATAAGTFFGAGDADIRGRVVTDSWDVPGPFRAALAARFTNRPGPRLAVECRNRTDGTRVELSLPEFTARPEAPRTLTVTLRDLVQSDKVAQRVEFDTSLSRVQDRQHVWQGLPDATRAVLADNVRHRFAGEVDTRHVDIGGVTYRATFERENVRFPFRPVHGHWLGLDSAGRDVLARILYGLRTSLTFGLVLVACSLCLGTLAGAAQGYYGGVVDITGQRLVEIWSALPFLYVMILLGSVYGRSFTLLIFCYGLFNWIGISYYMRAEFLRLRKKPFVEAARCLGLPAHKIVFRHILPNALVPLITLFPFSLVGAVGSLAALDYLGFGLPPPTPSWGELLQQAQQFRWAWWLILYPALALFVVMLLGVMIGEGVRNAFDPQRYSVLE